MANPVSSLMKTIIILSNSEFWYFKMIEKWTIKIDSKKNLKIFKELLSQLINILAKWNSLVIF